MERTESKVVQVPPDYENDKVKEMELFGWNLQGRQEVIGHLREAEHSDDIITDVWRAGVEGATGKKYVEYDHYVKLHFTRSPQSSQSRAHQGVRIPIFQSSFPPLPTLGATGRHIWLYIVAFLVVSLATVVFLRLQPEKSSGPCAAR